MTREISKASSKEVKSKGAHASRAPTCNIQRSVTNRRNFESYSKDSFLTAELAIGEIQGLQGKEISAMVKHFASNESEVERTTILSDIDVRTLRKVYLVPVRSGGQTGHNIVDQIVVSQNQRDLCRAKLLALDQDTAGGLGQ